MFEIKISEEQVRDFFKKYDIDFSLKYPEKAALPLEEFCNFYFRSRDIKLSFNKRIKRAYNDVISYGLKKISEQKQVFDSIDDFLEFHKDTLEDCMTKATFSKELAHEYKNSDKTATELWTDYMISSNKLMP